MAADGPLLLPLEKGVEGEGWGEKTRKRALPRGQSPQSPPQSAPLPVVPASPPIPPTRCSCQALKPDRWGGARPGASLCHTPRTSGGVDAPPPTDIDLRAHRSRAGDELAAPQSHRGSAAASPRGREAEGHQRLEGGMGHAVSLVTRLAARGRGGGAGGGRAASAPAGAGAGLPLRAARAPPLISPPAPDPRAHPPTASTHIPAAATGACRCGLLGDPALPVDRRLRFHTTVTNTKRRAARAPPSLPSAPSRPATQPRHACGVGGGGRARGR